MSKIKVVFLCLLISGCSQLSRATFSDEEIAILNKNAKMHKVSELQKEVAVYDHVAIGLGLPLRKYLNQDGVVSGKRVLDLGAGSGVLSLIALDGGARLVVATDINPYAVANVEYNARRFGFTDRINIRLVSMDDQGAYSVINTDERFDLIVSNPPQGAESPKNLYDFSFADPRLAFLKSIIKGLPHHLAQNGKGVFALYEQSLKLLQRMSVDLGLEVKVILKTYNRNGVYYLVEVQRN